MSAARMVLCSGVGVERCATLPVGGRQRDQVHPVEFVVEAPA